MYNEIDEIFNLIDELTSLEINGLQIFPGKMIIDSNKLHKINDSFPKAISDFVVKTKKEAKEEALQNIQNKGTNN